jgi:hypothetical protein
MGKLYSDMTDIRESLDVKVCMNEVFKDNTYTHSPPLILLSNICWSCKTDTYLQGVSADV